MRVDNEELVRLREELAGASARLRAAEAEAARVPSKLTAEYERGQNDTLEAAKARTQEVIAMAKSVPAHRLPSAVLHTHVRMRV